MQLVLHRIQRMPTGVALLFQRRSAVAPAGVLLFRPKPRTIGIPIRPWGVWLLTIMPSKLNRQEQRTFNPQAVGSNPMGGTLAKHPGWNDPCSVVLEGSTPSLASNGVMTLSNKETIIP